jgi:hypothetical protein
MREIMVSQAQTCDLKELVAKFIPEVIGKEIEKVTQGIYPLQNTFVRKVKILKAPKFDLMKLMEVSRLQFITLFQLSRNPVLVPSFFCIRVYHVVVLVDCAVW